jgi:hemerythrin-like domain-containing protein
MSIRQFLSLADSFCQQLEFHHSIEEQHIFPLLARKMPQFQSKHELLTQHVVIHKGLDALQGYVKECQSGERELRLGELKVVLDGFGTVLWEHMDDEVRALGAENMRQFWTREEMGRLPI